MVFGSCTWPGESITKGDVLVSDISVANIFIWFRQHIQEWRKGRLGLADHPAWNYILYFIDILNLGQANHIARERQARHPFFLSGSNQSAISQIPGTRQAGRLESWKQSKLALTHPIA